ncbi:hypothetical protein B0H16DRAFT_1476204 [Mycena metata]|uniref:phytol kinase n=1 Tax=Mycena metata TaxID=1033252 RepID=A0AAD7HC02_9AGAR|nr:hypothetical protein B0H16DRAFT_1476204 [Mycena metata]
MFSGKFHNDRASYTLIKSTPAFWSILGDAWFHITQAPEADLPPRPAVWLFADLSGFIEGPEAAEPNNLTQIMEGVAIDPSLDHIEGTGLPLGTYGLALLSEHVVPILTNGLSTGMRVLAQGGDPGEMHTIAGTIWRTSNLLTVLLVKSPGNHNFTVALKSGLLRAVAASAHIPDFPPLQELLAHWADVVIPRHLLFHEVLRALGPALEDIADVVTADAFRQSAVYEKWSTFHSLAHEHLQILDSPFLDKTRALRACDNVECLTIQPKALFERCSGCSSFCYCCKACQVSDWRVGGHRNACQSCDAEAREFHVLTRDRAFFRALMNHDYQKSKITVLQDELVFRHTHPGEPYFLIYNYSIKGVVKIEPHLFGSNQSLSGFTWTDTVSRVARSKGRMRLDVLVFTADADGAGWLAIPFRRNTARVDIGLERLAIELRKNRDTWDMGYVTKVLAALALPEDLELETH